MHTFQHKCLQYQFWIIILSFNENIIEIELTMWYLFYNTFCFIKKRNNIEGKNGGKMEKTLNLLPQKNLISNQVPLVIFVCFFTPMLNFLLSFCHSLWKKLFFVIFHLLSSLVLFKYVFVVDEALSHLSIKMPHWFEFLLKMLKFGNIC